MAHVSRIPTPFKQHWNRFRLGWLPIISFLLCVAVALILWRHQAQLGTVVGEVEAYQVDVVAGIDGLLISPNGETYWKLLDEVKKGEILARLDDSLLRAELQAIVAEADHLQAELQAVGRQLKLDQDSLQQNHLQNQLRLTWELEQRRVERLQQAVLIREDMAALSGIQASLDMLEGLGQQGGLVSQSQLVEQRRQRDLIQSRIDDNKKVLSEIDKQFRDAEQRIKEFPELQLGDAEAMLAPVRAEIKVQESLMETIKVQIDNLVIKSPVDGTISAIYRWPGQKVVSGDLVFSLLNKDARYVVTYVREQQRIQPQAGMEVGLRLRTVGSPEYRSTIETVGPSAAPVPPRLLRDQAVLEWATPVRILIPAELPPQALQPGQLLQVIFHDRG